MDPKTKAQEVYIAAIFDDFDNVCDRLTDTNDKLTSALGVIATATEELKASADNLVDKKLIDLNNHVNDLGGEKVNNMIKEALNKAVASELNAIQGKVDAITTELRALHRKAGRRQLVAAACAGGLASLLTLAVTGWALKTSAVPVDIRVDSESVARLVINGIKQITKPTK